VSYDRLVLGTAQFGMDYGIANGRGKVPIAEVDAILKNASAAGVVGWIQQLPTVIVRRFSAPWDCRAGEL